MSFRELEVYLGYPVMLKERLGLPIDVEGMLYFGCSALKSSDLDEAENHVKAKLSDEAAYFGFLINHEVWLGALEAKFPAEIAAIREERDAMSEDENNTWEKIQETYNNRLTELSKRALGRS
jgi:hypothetical protein